MADLANYPILRFMGRIEDDGVLKNSILCHVCCSVFRSENQIDIDRHLASHQAQSKYRKARPVEYLVRTYMKILRRDYGDGELVYPNFEKIYPKIILKVLLPQSLNFGMLYTETAHYISCIMDVTTTSKFYPVVVQYYGINTGIQQRLISFMASPDSINVLLHEGGLLRKIVAFSGDFCPKNSASAESSHFLTLSGHCERLIINLPDFKKIHRQVSRVIYDSLPENYLGLISATRHTFLQQGTVSAVVEQLQQQYCKTAPKRNKEIFDVSFVFQNYNIISDFMNVSTYVPEKLKIFFQDQLTPFYLSWILEVHELMLQHEIKENSGVVGYLKLLSLMEFLDKLKNELVLSPIFQEYLPQEQLVDVTQKLCQSMTKGYEYLSDVLMSYSYFSYFSWVLPKNYFGWNQLHRSYHLLMQITQCSDCELLVLEFRRITKIIAILPKESFNLENVSDFWSLVVRNTERFGLPPVIFIRLLQILFCIPAYNDIVRDSDIRPNSNNIDFEVVERVVKDSFRMTGEQFVSNVNNGLLRGRKSEIEAIVNNTLG